MESLEDRVTRLSVHVSAKTFRETQVFLIYVSPLEAGKSRLMGQEIERSWL